jgi:nitric oxide reductase NorE protein
MITRAREPQPNADASTTTRRIPGEEGIWVFVLGDMTVFAVFFAAFMYSRARNPSSFADDHESLNVVLGTTNTVLLLTSSLFVVLGAQKVLSGTPALASRLFGAALACGVGFVAVKAIEWSRLFMEHKTVGTGEYFSYYFVFTGIHLLHVFLGIVVLSRLLALSRRPEITPRQRLLCETGGIFWHMVDLLWVVLFALFYLVR